MGRKIFVSYKYADSDVKQFTNLSSYYRTPDTARSYVDLLEQYLRQKSDHVYKGESDGEDLSQLSDSTIKDKLYDRIFDSTMTIVILSKGMDNGSAQKYQWIPQEISYSLREQSRTNSSGKSITSGTNAILAIVLPDRSGSYSYFWNTCSQCSTNCTMYNTLWLFEILRKNTFNIKQPDSETCNSRLSTIYHGDSSYITYVTWEDFVGNEEEYIDKAYAIQAKKDQYTIHVSL